MPRLISVAPNYTRFASNATQISEADLAGLQELQRFYRSELERLHEVWSHKVHQGRSLTAIGDTAREYDRVAANLAFVERRLGELQNVAVSS